MIVVHSTLAGEDRVLASWNPQRRTAIEQAAAARGVPWAVGSVGAFAVRTEHYVADWKAMYQDVCEARTCAPVSRGRPSICAAHVSIAISRASKLSST